MQITTVLASKGPSVVTIRPAQTIREALSLLTAHNIGVVVVIDEAERPVGILSERDIVRAAARDDRFFTRPVSAIMTRELILAQPQDDLDSVAHTMTERRIRHLPVVDGGRLVGIVSIGDVLKVQRDQYRGEVDTLEIQLLAPRRGDAGAHER
jgi:CBS domain-containing protein